MAEPRYREIAAEIRRQIESGELRPGDRIPSQAEMIERYRVSDGVAKDVVRELRDKGLITSKPGSGVFVRDRPPVRTLTRSWYQEFRGGFPDDSASGGAWTYRSETALAPLDIRERLALREAKGEAPDVMWTRYVRRSEGGASMLINSYEVYELTRGTAIVFPEEGPSIGLGVAERMSMIGIDVTDAAEIVRAREASAEEASALALPSTAFVLHLRRTHLAGDKPVETSDVIVPADRFEVMYPIPVRTRAAGNPEERS